MTEVRLDKSKQHSNVIGDRMPDDPHYNVHHWQDGLPFDVKGNLVPDDKKVGPWMSTTADGKPVQHWPLWNDIMRSRLEKKINRLTKAAADKTVPQEDEVENPMAELEEREKSIADVNLESWLRGEVNYQPWQLFGAAKERFKTVYTATAQLVADAVLDHKIVNESEVCPSLRKLLDKAAPRPGAVRA